MPLTIPRKHITPSYAQGFARSQGESAFPGLWRGLVGAWVPGLGVQSLGTNGIKDQSGLGNDGATQGSMTGADWVIAGSRGLGYALDFTTDDYIDCGQSAAHDLVSDMTIAMWLKSDSLTASDSFCAKRSSANNWPFVFLSGGATVRALRLFSNAGSNANVSMGTEIPATGWHHIVVTRSNTTINFYVDAIEDSSNPQTLAQGSSAPSDTLFIGAQNNGSSNTGFLEGQIAELRLYNRALTPNEIQLDYLNPLAPFRRKALHIPAPAAAATTTRLISIPRKHITPSYAQGYARSAGESAFPGLWRGLVGAWVPAFGVSGDTLHDLTGNGNDGTLTAMELGTDWVMTPKGYALDFDGVAEYVILEKTWTLGINFTLSLWMRTTTSSQVDFAFRTVNVGSNGIVGLGLNTNESSVGEADATFFQVRTDDNTTRNASFSNAALYDGNVHLVTLLRTGTVTRCYLDGIEQSLTTGLNSLTAVAIPFEYPVTFGADNLRGTIGSFSDYDLLSFVYHNRALTPTEIALDYANPLAPFRRKSLLVGVSAAEAALTDSERFVAIEALMASGAFTGRVII